MTRTYAIFAFAAAALVAGCERETITSGEPYDPQANVVQNLENVELPPAIAASHTYRCADNSLVYIDWLNNDTARVKKTQSEVGTTVTKGEGDAYAAEGQELSGTPTAESITLNGQTCNR